jgi:hypothetical protein
MNPVCTMCSNGGSFNGTTCSPCAVWQYYDPTNANSHCQNCSVISNCAQCNSSTNCTMCAPGYTVNAAGQCVSCSSISQCQACAYDFSGTLFCTQCANSYSVSADKLSCFACTTIDAKCTSCQNSMTCTSCVYGFGPSVNPLTNTVQCRSCSDMFPQCLDCGPDPNSGALVCMQCVDGMYFHTFAKKCMKC